MGEEEKEIEEEGKKSRIGRRVVKRKGMIKRKTRYENERDEQKIGSKRKKKHGNERKLKTF